MTDPTTKVETKEEMVRVVGMELLGKYSGGLFTAISSLTTGEASTVVRGTVSKEEGKCGFRAVRKLMMRFNPKTPAKLFKMLGEVVSPGGAKQVREVPKLIEEWEVKVRRLESEFGEGVSEAMKVAILIQILPKEMQDMVFQMGSLVMGGGEKVDYKEIRDKVISVAGNRAEQRRPKENDVDGAWWEEEEYGEDEGDEKDVGALGRGLPWVKCYRCGGLGTWRRSVPHRMSQEIRGKGRREGLKEAERQQGLKEGSREVERRKETG